MGRAATPQAEELRRERLRASATALWSDPEYRARRAAAFARPEVVARRFAANSAGQKRRQARIREENGR